MKKHKGFIIFFISIMLLYLHELIFMKSSFLGGDYLSQFYPWSKFYAESIKNFQFPFWSNSFHSGFPLMAEGQVGGFYPLNIVTFFIFLFRFAYNLIIVGHFILGGIFCYLFSRKLGSNQQSGTLAVLLFCFGSAYAGCFYNVVTMKTLVWFPLVLLMIEYFFDTLKLRFLIIAGLVTGIQFPAGFFPD